MLTVIRRPVCLILTVIRICMFYIRGLYVLTVIRRPVCVNSDK